MTILTTSFEGVYEIECPIYKDSRGWFYESYRQDNFHKITGKNISFVQDNQSFSQYGTLRGMHFQKEPYGQAKLIRVLKGKVQDVIIDLRPESITYQKYLSVVLSEENKKQLFVPRGFAHGFLVISDFAEVLYKCDNFYTKKAESGIHYNDSKIGIDWLLEESKLILSEKDKAYPYLA